MNTIGELLKRNGIQQKELAIAIGVSQPTVSDWVRNRKDPTEENVRKLARFFQISELVIKGIEKLPFQGENESSDEIWQIREDFRRNPELRTLHDLQRNATKKELKQIEAFIRAIRSGDKDDVEE